MSRRHVLSAMLVLAGVAAAQGVLTYPDVYYYKFNEGAGNQVVNYAIPQGGGNPAAPSFESAIIPVNWNTATPRLGTGAWNPGGVGGQRLLSNGPTNLSQSYTIECWMKTNFTYTGGQLGRLFGDYSTATFRCYIGWYGPGAHYLGGNTGNLCGACASATSGSATAPLANVCDQNWHHLALVFDAAASTITGYVDGNLDQQQAAAPGAIGTNFMLGGVVGAGDPFNGSIDEFRFWSEARSQAQIQAGMNTELAPPQAQANFTASRLSGSAPLLVKFTDQSTTPSPAGITQWAWDFDGDTLVDDTTQHPCHPYQAPGSYTVSLTVSDGATQSTRTYINYISVGAAGFTFATCGGGDVYLAAPIPPTGWIHGYTLFSFDTNALAGAGWFLGLYPDLTTFSFANTPAAAGSPFHFLNVGIPGLYPDAPFILPSGSASALAGVSMDAVVVYLDGASLLINYSPVARVRF